VYLGISEPFVLLREVLMSCSFE